MKSQIQKSQDFDELHRPGNCFVIPNLWDPGLLARAAYGELMRAATEVRDQGSFSDAAQAMSGKEINGIFGRQDA